MNTYLAMPSYAGVAYNADAPLRMGDTDGHTVIGREGHSLLAFTFNQHYTEALRTGCDRFALLHSDIIPDRDWLKTLHQEMDETGADIVSAVVPLKDITGLTSTGHAPAGDKFSHARRYTLHEIAKMPPTFGSEVVPEGRTLLLNSGCMLVNLHAPWVRLVRDGKLVIRFHIDDEILYLDDVGLKPICAGEDWNFSREAQEIGGGKVVATSKIEVCHVGPFSFSSKRPYGAKTSEEADAFETKMRAQLMHATNRNLRDQESEARP